MKVMISLPMANISDKKVKSRIQELKEKFEKLHIEVVDSFLTDEIKDSYNPGVYYLGRTLTNFMHIVDAVYFDDDWEKARGCRIERKICEEYNIMILDNSFFNKTTISTDNIFNGEIKFQPFLTKMNDKNNIITPNKATWNDIEKSFGQKISKHIPYID